jgi:O-acetyl-ADP-ribose deacetylase (regulator of RNase III)
MKILRGDLIELAKAGEFDAIIQGCNCQCRMGRGIALTIKQQSYVEFVNATNPKF